MNKKILTPKDIDRRKKLSENFLRSDFYLEIFEPHVLSEIENNNKISSISDEQEAAKILIEFHKKKYKRNIYQGILNKIQTWANSDYKQLKNPKGGKK